MDVRDIPVFLTVRDRVSCLRLMVEWLECAGQRNIVLLDNDSTYPPCVAFLKEQGCRVRYLGANLGHEALAVAGLIPEGAFILSDPDLIPQCPPESIEHWWDLSVCFRGYLKYGPGLVVAPDTTQECRGRRQLEVWWGNFQISEGVYEGEIDTTFALYPANWQEVLRRGRITNVGQQAAVCLYTGEPLVMRHPDWEYVNGQVVSEEDEYYLRRADRKITTVLGHWVVKEDSHLVVQF